MTEFEKEDWRKKCETCEIRDTCVFKNYASYCSGVIDVGPLIKMIEESEK